jgi:hypothetical protein
MITSIYRGGLGNQLFQVITGYYLAEKNNDEYGINPNLYRGGGQGNSISVYTDSIFKNIQKTNHESKVIYKEPRFNYTDIEYSEDLLLDGFFPTEKYFLNKKYEINNLLDFKCNEEITNVCVIHIRTGDYLNESNFNVVTPKYFENAINHVLSINPDISFKIVSDSNNHVSRYIPDNIKYEFVSSDELQDLRTISQCDFAIISNSSFSWWGSYLGKSKITLAPNRWLNVNCEISDIYREDMIKINI